MILLVLALLLLLSRLPVRHVHNLRKSRGESFELDGRWYFLCQPHLFHLIQFAHHSQSHSSVSSIAALSQSMVS